jgi:hypothetical protein
MLLREASGWSELLQQPAGGDHFVQVYRDPRFLVEVVTEYVGTGLRAGEAVLLVAIPEHRAAFLHELEARGIDVAGAEAAGQLVLLDAVQTLQRFTAGGMPDWRAFHAEIGGVIAKLRLDHPSVRAYGEMVDVLWQRGERDAAIRLEEFWNRSIRRPTTRSSACARYTRISSPRPTTGASTRR